MKGLIKEQEPRPAVGMAVSFMLELPITTRFSGGKGDFFKPAYFFFRC